MVFRSRAGLRESHHRAVREAHESEHHGHCRAEQPRWATRLHAEHLV
jgi:hypothetical protein